MTDYRWQDDAKCLEVGPDVYFVPQTYKKRAQALCAGCPVQAECLEFALKTDSRCGVWGGTSEHQRAPLHAKYNREHRPDGRAS